MKNRSILIRCFIGFVLLVIATGTAAAQSGSLQVQVFGADGPLTGAVVTLSNHKGYVKTVAVVTDRDGVAEFPVLRAGTGYAIEVSFPGCGTIKKDGIRVPINRTTMEGVRLTTELNEFVEVEAERDVVDLEKVETSTRFSDEFIQDLPVPGRFYQNILTMAPGVQDADGDGNPNVHGSRSRDFKAIVSGVSNVDPLTGRWMNQVNPNSIEEMEIVTAGAGVEYGRAQGGFANIIQKQGSNEFEGLAELIYRTSKLDGDSLDSSRGSGFKGVSYTWWQPSVQFSGPIIRDRLWYRLSHEYIDREIPVDIISSVATVTTRLQINADQLTWQASPRNKLAFQYQNDPMEISNLGVSSIRGPESARNYEYGGDIYSLTWTAPYSPKILVNTTFAYQDTEQRMGPSHVGIQNDCYPRSRDGQDHLLTYAQCLDLTDVRYTGSWNRIDMDHRQRFSLGSTANLYGGRFWGMKHRFKVGMRFENERYFRDLTLNPSLVRFWSTGTFLLGEDDEGEVESDPSIQILSARVAIPARSNSTATGTNWAFFVEDQVKPSQNLTMTFGVRVDSEGLDALGRSILDPEVEFNNYEADLALIEVDGHEATVDDLLGLIVTNFTARGSIVDYYEQVADAVGLPGIFCSGMCSPSFRLKKQQLPDNLALRNTNLSTFFSAAWDPWSDGKTKISIAAGRHYNNTILRIPMLEQEPVTSDVMIECTGAYCHPVGNNIVPNISEVRRDLRTPYQDEWVVSFERELFQEVVGRVTYIERKYRDQFQDIDLNHVPGDYYTNALCTLGPSEVALGPDGILDDCTGRFLQPKWDSPEEQKEPPIDDDDLSIADDLWPAPDGYADLYIQNPFWGEVYEIGNYNNSDYEAYVLEIVRRQYRGWELQGSYTWSESVGDGEDFAQMIGDDRTLTDDEYGYQSQDQRHVVKLNATSVTPWGFRLGASITWQSGLPYSDLDWRGSLDAIPPSQNRLGLREIRSRISYPTGARNSERNRSWWNVDAKFTKEMNLQRGMNLRISAEVFNLLDERVYQVYSPGYEEGQQINGENEAMVTQGRQFQIGCRLSF